MHRTTVAAKRLEFADALAQAFQPFNRRQRRAGQYIQFRQRLLDRFDAAQPAAAGAGQLSPLLFEVPEGPAGDFDLGLHRRTTATELEIVDFIA
ncbi:hypothetical protein ALP75_204166 [Pseudomonas syringae pv. actinidiae]|nr:hypothetical protein ALP75_204166 [Pseudomonas syringae pv. actinidiae]